MSIEINNKTLRYHEGLWVIFILVGAVRDILGQILPKATKFGTDIEQIILFRFAMDAKTGIAQDRC